MYRVNPFAPAFATPYGKVNGLAETADRQVVEAIVPSAADVVHQDIDATVRFDDALHE